MNTFFVNNFPSWIKDRKFKKSLQLLNSLSNVQINFYDDYQHRNYCSCSGNIRHDNAQITIGYYTNAKLLLFSLIHQKCHISDSVCGQMYKNMYKLEKSIYNQTITKFKKFYKMNKRIKKFVKQNIQMYRGEWSQE